MIEVSRGIANHSNATHDRLRSGVGRNGEGHHFRAQAVLGKRLGRVAALAGAIGGELPDADILLPFADPALPMEYHRHFTHALAFIPVAGLLALLPFLVRARWRPL